MPAAQKARNPHHQPAVRGEASGPAKRKPPHGQLNMALQYAQQPEQHGWKAPAWREFSGDWLAAGFTQSIVYRNGLFSTECSQVCSSLNNTSHSVLARTLTVRDACIPGAVHAPAAHFPVRWAPVQWTIRRIHPLPVDFPDSQFRNLCGSLCHCCCNHSIPAFPAGGLFHFPGQHEQLKSAGAQS